MNNKNEYIFVQKNPFGDWHIYFGTSKFLVIEGAGWTTDLGKELFELIKSGKLDWKNTWVEDD